MLEYLLWMLVRRTPMFLLCLGGIVFAIIRWKRHPRVSLMTVLALVIYAVEAVLFTFLLYWLPNLTSTIHLSSTAMDWFYNVLFFCEDFVFAGVIILLVGAAFTGRSAEVVTSD